MGFIIFVIISIFWWIASLTILLPFVLLLKYWKAFQNRWFSFIFVNFLSPYFQPQMTRYRKECFELLKKNLSDRDKSKPLKILEIGIGSGANLPYYPENSSLIAVDMNASFKEYFYKNQKKYPQIKFERLITCMAENMSEVEDSSIDIVISTHVLCSVEDIQSVLSEIRRVLKPGGKFVYLEHCALSKKEWGYLTQKFAAPLWLLYFNGCHIDWHVLDELHRAGFSNIVCEKKYPPDLPVAIKPQYVGIATVYLN